ncbi:unnamed protein product, partial [Hymenolepis diminuta]
ILYCGSFNIFWSNQLLVFYSTIVVSSYSNSYKLVTVLLQLVVSCQPLVVTQTRTFC